MKKKIGFINYDNSDEPREESAAEPDQSKIREIILNSYLPVSEASEADELLSHTDMIEFFRLFTRDPHGAAVHELLTELGFKTKPFAGNIYWMVKTA